MMSFPSEIKQIEHAGSLDYEFDESLRAKDSEGNPIYAFEYAEHVTLGDMLTLQWHDGTTFIAKDKKLVLENGLQLTYGQINALGGDYFGSDQPICTGGNLEEQIERFRQGFATLAIDKAGYADANRLIDLKEKEVTLFNQAAQSGKAPSEVYYHDVPSTRDNILATIQGIFLRKQKGYLGLALINFDHFGHDARKAYNAGHTAALRQAASSKDPRSLEIAYAMNAFADHFLEDSFASGHLRVPRQALHGGIRYDQDLCAQFMHDEDNAFGLQVDNPKGGHWTVYGDKKLLDECNKSNLAKCYEALMASTREVSDAWSKGNVPHSDSFGAWLHAPNIASSFSDKNHAPLFNDQGCPRDEIENRWCRKYKGKSSWSWTYPSLLLQLKMSSAFKEPME